MDSLVRQKSVRERAVAASALAALRAEEEEEAALARELEQTLFEISQVGQLEPGARKKKKKKKKKKRQAIPEAPGSSQAREEDVAARLVHTKSQIDVLTRQLSGGAGGRTAEPPRTVSTELVRTKTQIAQLTRELSGVAGGGRSGAAESEDDVLDAQLRALGKEVYQIRPDGDCLFSAVLDQLARMETRVRNSGRRQDRVHSAWRLRRRSAGTPTTTRRS